MVTFNRRAFRVGWRRRVMMETERLPGRDQTRLIHSLRMGFGRYSVTGAASGLEAAARHDQHHRLNAVRRKETMRHGRARTV